MNLKPLSSLWITRKRSIFFSVDYNLEDTNIACGLQTGNLFLTGRYDSLDIVPEWRSWCLLNSRQRSSQSAQRQNQWSKSNIDISSTRIAKWLKIISCRSALQLLVSCYLLVFFPFTVSVRIP